MAQIKVAHVVFEQQLRVAMFDLLSGGHIGEIDQRPVEPYDRANKHMLHAPSRRYRRGCKVRGCLGPVALDVAARPRYGYKSPLDDGARRGRGMLAAGRR